MGPIGLQLEGRLNGPPNLVEKHPYKGAVLEDTVREGSLLKDIGDLPTIRCPTVLLQIEVSEHEEILGFETKNVLAGIEENVYAHGNEFFQRGHMTQ